jgi:sporulation integral membrane protein YlbJ
MFLFPSATFNGAAKGLLLWYNSVLPTLFPFMIISTLLINSNTISLISRILGPVFRRIFHISSSASFAILGGFLCGYPVGAKITAELVHSNKITSNEGSYLVSFCNNTSPIFMLNFVLIKSIKNMELIIPGMFIHLFSPILCSYLFYSFYYKKKMVVQTNTDYSRPSTNTHFFENLDISIMKSIDSIVQVGGYIILFSMLTSLFDTAILSKSILKSFIISLLEISNGITVISTIFNSIELKWLTSLFISSFGGLCSIAQTSCMLKNTKIPMKIYTIEKLITATVTSLLALLYLTIRKNF